MKRLLALLLICALLSGCSIVGYDPGRSWDEAYRDKYDRIAEEEAYQAEQIDHAYEDGYDAGYEQGHCDGYDDGFKDASTYAAYMEFLDQLCWIPIGGIRYHTDDKCVEKMKNLDYVTIGEAINRGYQPCGVCCD